MAELADGITFHLVNTLGWPSLRPLQREAVAPVRSGQHALLIAPTAGGKTEAAMLPLLSEMVEAPWRGLSVLYVTPLRALLNNLYPRLSTYAAWVGRRVGLWHGDVGAGERRRLLADPPDILLTTPESLEAMLVSTSVDHRYLFADLRALVVDELHAFAGDDRGWHLLAVAERLQVLAGRPLQRVGMTATVGNPEELLSWLTRGADGVVVAPPADGPAGADVVVDYVGSVSNAAKVIDLLHRGEKRLVFCQSRAQAEKLALSLREREVPTVVSHSSLSADERRRAEQTFAEASECVVVATSTLELGVDIGDLDRVVQLDAPGSVSSFLQRLGRTGRRAGSTRNMLFLATTEMGLVQSCAVLSFWGRGFVEPVVPPSTPWHIAAQQFLALALQEGRFSLAEWRDWWPGLEWMSASELSWLVSQGFLSVDGGFAFVGPAAERKFGRRNFLELTSVFTAAPELKVLHGRAEVGAVSPLALSSRVEGPRQLSLGGRTWLVTHVDWRRRQVFVVPGEGRGRSVWQGSAAVLGPELAGAVRDVLGGADQDVELSARAVVGLAAVREKFGWLGAGSTIVSDGSSCRWWTFVGSRANASLAAALEAQGLGARADGLSVTVDAKIGLAEARECDGLLAQGVGPSVDADALEGLKFSALLAPEVAAGILGERVADADRARQVAVRGIGVSVDSGV